MSIHKLTAGSGYDYLTRQVAALDATHKGHVGLAQYYTAKPLTATGNLTPHLRTARLARWSDPAARTLLLWRP